jgi:hypothetical protein
MKSLHDSFDALSAADHYQMYRLTTFNKRSVDCGMAAAARKAEWRRWEVALASERLACDMAKTVLTYWQHKRTLTYWQHRRA